MQELFAFVFINKYDASSSRNSERSHRRRHCCSPRSAMALCGVYVLCCVYVWLWLPLCLCVWESMRVHVKGCACLCVSALNRSGYGKTFAIYAQQIQQQMMSITSLFLLCVCVYVCVRLCLRWALALCCSIIDFDNFHLLLLPSYGNRFKFSVNLIRKVCDARRVSARFNSFRFFPLFRSVSLGANVWNFFLEKLLFSSRRDIHTIYI